MTIKEQIKTMNEEERKQFIHQKFLEIFNFDKNFFGGDEETIVLGWEDRIINNEKYNQSRQEMEEINQKYQTTRRIQGGFLISDDTLRHQS